MNEKERLMLLDWTRKIHTMEYAHRFESMEYMKESDSEESGRHCIIGAKLENLRHKCEAALCCAGSDTDDVVIILNEWYGIDKPNVSSGNFKKASEIIKELGSYPEKGIKHF